ncbi:FbpB family small basic protein [Ferdinandcohnia sp. SAFN-114]|uniref:FbpB family small basic protein n=1 Tax=Ferdinandcohnia sp. SAFN-114 TaxID=3387275 RepID=UPI003F7EEE47
MLKKGENFQKLVEKNRKRILEDKKEMERIDLLVEERQSKNTTNDKRQSPAKDS